MNSLTCSTTSSDNHQTSDPSAIANEVKSET